MNASFRHTTLLCLPLLLAACASDHSLSQTPPPARVLQAGAGPSIVKDAEYVSEVERIARRRGVEVVWVNPPSRHMTKLASN